MRLSSWTSPRRDRREQVVHLLALIWREESDWATVVERILPTVHEAHGIPVLPFHRAS